MFFTKPNKKIIYAPDGKTVVEVDFLAADGKTVLEADKYSNGLIQSVTTYLPDGKTVRETDTYTYSNGKLASVSMVAPLALMEETIVFNTNGSISEIDLSQLGQRGALIPIETDKFSVSGVLQEVDHYSAGKLANVQDYNPLGELTTLVSYDKDGKTVTETDAYKYGSGSMKPLSETKSDGTGKIFETDTFSYGRLGFVSQVAKVDGSGKLIEVDQYDVFGHLVSVTHPNTTTPTPIVNPTWSKVWGYGEIDVLKALTAVLGKAPADVVVPAAIQSQWDLGILHFQDAWAAGDTGKGIVVADIDTGIDLKNSSLTKNLSQYDWNFISNSSNVQDDNGHGSCTASEICAANDGKGVTGGAYDAQLMVLKALDAKGSGSDDNIVSAINYAVAHGANVINLSLGDNTPDVTLQTALKNAASNGVIVCMAAGNDGTASPDYPAIYAQGITDCIAVGATKQSGSGVAMASFSDQAGTATPYNFIDAPGVAIKGYGLNGAVLSWSGTSMAAPLVAAEAADILSAHTLLSVGQIVQDIVHTTVPLVGVAN
jgi:subtilisin family serine protease